MGIMQCTPYPVPLYSVNHNLAKRMPDYRLWQSLDTATVVASRLVSFEFLKVFHFSVICVMVLASFFDTTGVANV